MKKISITLNVLNSYFLNTNNNTINKDDLNDDLIMFIDNTRKYYDYIINSNRKITSIVWDAFIENSQYKIDYEGYEKKYEIDSKHLKKFINNDYSLLDETCKHCEELREQIKKEREEEKREQIKNKIDFITYTYNGNDKNGNRKIILNFYDKEKNNINDIINIGRKTKKGLSTIQYLSVLKKEFDKIKFIEL